jgi:starch synthase
MATSTRLLILDAEGIQDLEQESRNSGLYRELARRLSVTGVVAPRVGRVRNRMIQLTHFAPGRDRWRRRAGLSPMYFEAKTTDADRRLTPLDGTFDVLLQLYCLFAPGRSGPGRPYALYLDATLALTRRHYPTAAPLGRHSERRWRALETATYRGAGVLFAMSEWVRNSLVTDYGVDPSRIVVTGAGANRVTRTLPARKWDQRRALFVGLDWNRKGGPLLVKAWELTRREIPDAELWVVGPRRRERGADLPGVRWFGRLHLPDVIALYLEASLFVLPSRFDPFPHVLREALGHGVPCVTTRVGAIEEIVREGQDATIVPPGDERALADALISLLGDPRRAEAMGRAGHARVSEEVTWARVADAMTPHLLRIAQ